MLTTMRYVLLTALRDRLFIGLLIGVAFAAYVASVLGSTAMVETREMTLSLSAASARIILMVGLIVFVCFHLRYAFDSKEMDVFLSRPISRSALVLAYWLGFALVAALLVLPILGLLVWVGMLDAEGFGVWSLSLFLESLIVIAIALFSSFALKSGVSSVLASLGLYTLSRMMGFFVATAHSPLLNPTKASNVVMRHILEWISVLIPRVDLFGNTKWLLYGVDLGIITSILLPQTAVIVPLLLVATMWDLHRRSF